MNVIKYKDSDKKDNNCSICLLKYEDEDDIIVLKCTHIFHKECVNEWLKNNSNKCPVCREVVSEGTPDYLQNIN